MDDGLNFKTITTRGEEGRDAEGTERREMEFDTVCSASPGTGRQIGQICVQSFNSQSHKSPTYGPVDLSIDAATSSGNFSPISDNWALEINDISRGRGTWQSVS
jgi:hypothetical protein